MIFFEGTNPCDVNNGDCSHFCLTSATNSSGYSCACPDDMMLDDDQRSCIGTLAQIMSALHISLIFFFAVLPFILLSDYIYVRRMNLDGTGFTTAFTQWYTQGLDIDYRYINNITVQYLA